MSVMEIKIKIQKIIRKSFFNISDTEMRFSLKKIFNLREISFKRFSQFCSNPELDFELRLQFLSTMKKLFTPFITKFSSKTEGPRYQGYSS